MQPAPTHVPRSPFPSSLSSPLTAREHTYMYIHICIRRRDRFLSLSLSSFFFYTSSSLEMITFSFRPPLNPSITSPQTALLPFFLFFPLPPPVHPRSFCVLFFPPFRPTAFSRSQFIFRVIFLTSAGCPGIFEQSILRIKGENCDKKKKSKKIPKNAKCVRVYFGMNSKKRGDRVQRFGRRTLALRVRFFLKKKGLTKMNENHSFRMEIKSNT